MTKRKMGEIFYQIPPEIWVRILTECDPYTFCQLRATSITLATLTPPTNPIFVQKKKKFQRAVLRNRLSNITPSFLHGALRSLSDSANNPADLETETGPEVVSPNMAKYGENSALLESTRKFCRWLPDSMLDFFEELSEKEQNAGDNEDQNFQTDLFQEGGALKEMFRGPEVMEFGRQLIQNLSPQELANLLGPMAPMAPMALMYMAVPPAFPLNPEPEAPPNLVVVPNFRPPDRIGQPPPIRWRRVRPEEPLIEIPENIGDDKYDSED